MNAYRITEALGGSYIDRLAPFVEGISPRSVVAWRIRGQIAEKHRRAVILALEDHAREVLATLAEVKERGS